MALIRCPECGKEVSDKANVCIHCGFPIAEFLSNKSEPIGSYQIILNYPGSSKVKAIKVVREITGLELPKAKNLVDHTPMPILHGLKKEKAEEYANLLKSIGANVKIISDDVDTSEVINSNIPKCPTCQSTNIKKISSAQRAGSIIGFGIFSKNIGKTFECKNCGYKW